MAFWKKILKNDVTLPRPAADIDASLGGTAHLGQSPTGAMPSTSSNIGSGTATSAAERPIHARDAFFAPVMTEKTSATASRGQYVFAVSEGVNKPMIARAVSRRFGVTVTAVRMLRREAKQRRRGRIVGWKPGFKKAMVTIKKGQVIELQ